MWTALLHVNHDSPDMGITWAGSAGAPGAWEEKGPESREWKLKSQPDVVQEPIASLGTESPTWTSDSEDMCPSRSPFWLLGPWDLVIPSGLLTTKARRNVGRFRGWGWG